MCVDEFGYSVAIETAVPSWPVPTETATAASRGGIDSGSAYVFRTSDGGATYGQVAKLTAADAAADDGFGYSVAIDGSTIVVGAPGEHYLLGSAYIFRTTDGDATYEARPPGKKAVRPIVLALVLPKDVVIILDRSG